MILYEYEGKQLLANAGVAVPNAVLITRENKETFDVATLHFPVILKAQVASGHRAKDGGIIRAADTASFTTALQQLFSHTVCNEIVRAVLVEAYVEHSEEYYLSFSYDRTKRGPVLVYGTEGGSGVEERTHTIVPLDPENTTVPEGTPFPPQLLSSLQELFFSADCLLLEINPLIKHGDEWIALDAKVHLDDAAVWRHPEWHLEPRAPGRELNQRELAARQIDVDDYRGTAGASYVDLDGDIAVLASGGGASLVAFDALYKAGGRPANYVEYSGNPPKEKVEALANIVLSKPNIKGLWIVGAVANFTDIYETLLGVTEGIGHAEKALGTSFDFPIVIRRGGPRDDEAFAMLKQKNDPRLFITGRETSIQESAAHIVAKAYTATPV